MYVKLSYAVEGSRSSFCCIKMLGVGAMNHLMVLHTSRMYASHIVEKNE